MLIEAMHKLTKVIIPAFWPFALSYAKYIHNHSRRQGEKKTPHEIFTDEEDTDKSSNFRVFGCPVFVLSRAMQAGKPTGKFSKQRSHIGIFVGFSPNHASNVPLIYNPETQHVSPQYHLVYDEDFTTASTSTHKATREKILKQFDSLFAESQW